ncbi:hypothetical protein SPURM210S_01516 [Streptomyces purpurascens]
MPYAPMTAAIRTDTAVTRSATTVSSPAVTSSAAVITYGPASAASADSSNGNWATARAEGRGNRKAAVAGSRPYADQITASTADAAAAYPVPSVPVRAASCSAYASRTVRASPSPATDSAVDRSPRFSRSTGPASAASVTAPSTSARPVMPI